jgi:predicted HTH domain antitoxin
VIALLKRKRVSLKKAWRLLSLKCSLLKSSVRLYTV